MKIISVKYGENGEIADVSNNSVYFEQENESVQINATIDTDKKVRAYIKAPNDNSAVTDEIPLNDGTYSLVIDRDYMAKGTLYIGFEAYDDSGYTERYEPVKIYIDSFVSLSDDKNDNVYVVTVSVGGVQTLEAGESATVENVGNKKDMVLKFGIPKGEKGDTPVKGVDYYTPEEIKEVAEEIEKQLDDEITEYNIITQAIPSQNKTLSTRVIGSAENITVYGEVSAVSSGNKNIPYYTVEEVSNPTFNIKVFKNNTQVSDDNFNIFYDKSTTDKVLRALPGYDCMDTLHMDSESNYIITKKIRKAVLDGSEWWVKVAAYDNLFYCNLHETDGIFTDTEIKAMSSGVGLLSEDIGFSNWFGKMHKIIGPGYMSNNAWQVTYREKNTRLYIHCDEFSTLDELTAKLSETPFVFYYTSVDGDEIYNLKRNVIPKYINNKITDNKANKISVSSSLNSFECTVKSELKDRMQDYENTIGDIETALDSIIAMQRELIGGDEA